MGAYATVWGKMEKEEATSEDSGWHRCPRECVTAFQIMKKGAFSKIVFLAVFWIWCLRSWPGSRFDGGMRDRCPFLSSLTATCQEAVTIAGLTRMTTRSPALPTIGYHAWLPTKALWGHLWVKTSFLFFQMISVLALGPTLAELSQLGSKNP